MASSLCKIILTTATLAALSVILTVDAQSFTKPIENTNVPTYGNLSGSVDFAFTYTVPNNNRIGSISCGYGSTYVAQKKNTQPATIQGGFAGRAEIVTDITGSSLTIKLKNLNFNDAKALSCLLIYDGLPFTSGTYSLSIYERPRFVDCLNAGIVNINLKNEFTLNEGQTLNSTCINYGNPVPFLQCSVLNKDGFVDNGATKSSERKNYTAQPPTKRLLFYNIRRTATKVRCVADGGVFTGKATVEKNVVVDYAPEAPEKIEPIETTYNSIKFKWTAPKDSGRSKIFVYYLTATHPNGTITGKNLSTPTTNTLLEHIFYGLQRESDYPIGVSGYNSVGQGKVRTSTIRTVPYKAPDAGGRTATGLSTGSIVGIVFGVLIFIVIVVIIVFFVMKKRQEAARYPQAYVEEAVDYPPGDSAMYSKVQKKPASNPYDESTSGYPDIIHQAKPVQPEEKKMLPRNDGREKDGASPSYESSRKEYV